MKNINPLLIFCALMISFSANAQQPNSRIGQGEINEKYLEHLIKIKIDSVRARYDCKPLVNDSILYVAADHHANYMIANNRLTHNEEDNPETRTPQNRADFYGAKHYFVGENVLKTNANSQVKTKKKRVFNTETYGELATSIVHGWVNSPGHFKNIITPDYQITGVAVAYKDGKVYACQKFAQVQYKYEFEESPTFFQYSDFEPEPVVASFAGIKRELVPKHKYEWGLRHDNPEKCAECDELVQQTPYITLRYERGNFILRVENAEFVQKLIQDKKDGFAVEIVEYNDYACGNPKYYTRPSRRNGRTKTNGILIEPLYRDQLLKGYKKRKKKKEVKFLSYLFGADSVKFKNRISGYKMAQYSSEYFEIKLGKMPKGVTGAWMHNLVYIQDGEICHIDYFTGHCVGLYMDTVAFDFMPLDTQATRFKFGNQKKKQYFTIPFEQNKSDYSKADIAPFIESLKNVDYIVDSIHIKAYASVEGDSISNHALLKKRAASILSVWQANQMQRIKANVETEIFWSHFYSAVRVNAKYRKMASMDKGQVIEALNDPETQKDLEPILKSERKAEITLFISVPPGDQNVGFLIKENIRELSAELKRPLHTNESVNAIHDTLNNLYALAHQKTVEGVLSPDYLASLEVPGYNTEKPLMEKFLLYGYEFQEAFSKNAKWVDEQEKIRTNLAQSAVKSVSPVFWYDHAYLHTRALMASRKIDQAKIQAIMDILQPLRNFYYSDTVARDNIESLNFNLNMFLLNYIFNNNPVESSNDAQTALDQISLYYLQRDTIGPERILNMARMAVYFNNNEQAQRLCVPYFDRPEIIKYIVPLSYVHQSANGSPFFYSYLIQLSNEIDESTWCNLFMNECGIPFQAFDHEELRDVFCEKCQEKNDWLNER